LWRIDESHVYWYPNFPGNFLQKKNYFSGLRFSSPNDLEKLIKVSIDSARITHPNPCAIFGAVVAALFTSYAIQGRKKTDFGIFCEISSGVPLFTWGKKLLLEWKNIRKIMQELSRGKKKKFNSNFFSSWRLGSVRKIWECGIFN
jgi:ADP-ribosylglycohydrolase